MNHPAVVVMFAPPDLISFVDAAKLTCPLLSQIESDLTLTRVACIVDHCSLWKTVVPPPGDKHGTCLGVCSLPQVQRDLVVTRERDTALLSAS